MTRKLNPKGSFPPMPILRKQYAAMPDYQQAAVDRLVASYARHSDFDKKCILAEAMEVVRRAVACTSSCHAGQTIEERLADLGKVTLWATDESPVKSSLEDVDPARTTGRRKPSYLYH